MIVPTVWGFRLLEIGSGIVVSHQTLRAYHYDSVVRKSFVEHESWVIYRAGGQKAGYGPWKGGGGVERMLQERSVSRRNANIK